MKTIKTKAHVEGIKTLDRAADVTKHAKNTYIRTKETAEGTKKSHQSSPSEYAADSTDNAIQTVTQDVVTYTAEFPKRAYNSARRTKNKFQEIRNHQHFEKQPTGSSTPVRTPPRVTSSSHNPASIKRTARGINTTGYSHPVRRSIA